MPQKTDRNKDSDTHKYQWANWGLNLKTRCCRVWSETETVLLFCAPFRLVVVTVLTGMWGSSHLDEDGIFETSRILERPHYFDQKIVKYVLVWRWGLCDDLGHHRPRWLRLETDGADQVDMHIRATRLDTCSPRVCWKNWGTWTRLKITTEMYVDMTHTSYMHRQEEIESVSYMICDSSFVFSALSRASSNNISCFLNPGTLM